MNAPVINLRRLFALCRKESTQIVRDPSSILIAAVLPVILLFIFGFGVNLDANRVRVGVVVEDPGAQAQRFLQVLQGSPYFDLQQSGSRAQLRSEVNAGAERAMIVIPSDFSANVLRGQGAAAIELLADGSEPNTANFVDSYVQGVWQTWMDRQGHDPGGAAAPQIELSPRFWFNPGTVSRNYLVPGSICVIMTIIGALLTSLVIAREWERGTMEALLATPVTRAEILLSKILPYYLLGLFALLLCVGVANQVMHVPFRGSIAALLLVGTLFLGSGLGLGLLLSTLMRNQFHAAQLALVAAFLPAVMLSGFVFEIASMPEAVRLVSYLVPARYLVSALQTLFQAGDDWPVLLPNIAFLAVSAVFWLGWTALKFRRRLD